MTFGSLLSRTGDNPPLSPLEQIGANVPMSMYQWPCPAHLRSIHILFSNLVLLKHFLALAYTSLLQILSLVDSS